MSRTAILLHPRSSSSCSSSGSHLQSSNQKLIDSQPWKTTVQDKILTKICIKITSFLIFLSSVQFASPRLKQPNPFPLQCKTWIQKQFKRRQCNSFKEKSRESQFIREQECTFASLSIIKIMLLLLDLIAIITESSLTLRQEKQEIRQKILTKICFKLTIYLLFLSFLCTIHLCKIETVKSDCIPMQSLKKETIYEDKYLRFKRDNKAVHSWTGVHFSFTLHWTDHYHQVHDLLLELTIAIIQPKAHCMKKKKSFAIKSLPKSASRKISLPKSASAKISKQSKPRSSSPHAYRNCF